MELFEVKNRSRLESGKRGGEGGVGVPRSDVVQMGQPMYTSESYRKLYTELFI